MRHRQEQNRLRFAEHIASFPDDSAFAEFWKAFRRRLFWEIRRRGLASSSPRLLGFPTWPKWSHEAVEELAHDCYEWAICRRIRALKSRVGDPPAVETLVRFNIRNFVTSRQRQFDPVGYRIFEILRSVLAAMVANGDLLAPGPSGGKKIDNKTLFGWTTDISEVTIPRSLIEQIVGHWSGEFLLDALGRKGEGQRRLTQQLQDRIQRLRKAGISLFAFKDLADPIKKEARSRWRDLDAQRLGITAWEGNDQDALLVPVAQPENLLSRIAFGQLTNCLRNRARALDPEDKDRGTLESLIQLLSVSALDPNQEAAPSQRGVAGKLGISRDRLARLYRRLQEWVRDCNGIPGQTEPHPRFDEPDESVSVKDIE